MNGLELSVSRAGCQVRPERDASADGGAGGTAAAEARRRDALVHRARPAQRESRAADGIPTNSRVVGKAASEFVSQIQWRSGY
jgi:hypothetical protein